MIGKPELMKLPPLFIAIGLIWFFGWGFLWLKFPRQVHRVFSFGKEPSPRNLKIKKISGYLAIGFGTLLPLEWTFGLLR